MPPSLKGFSFGAPVYAGIRTLRVCAGIGDNIWLIQKLVNAQERFKFLVAGEEPRRGRQIFDLLPSLAFSTKYGEFYSRGVAIANATRPEANATWASLRRRDDFYLSANEYMETGRRIEEFLPDLPTSFRIDWMCPPAAKAEAAELLPEGVRWIGLYGCCYSTARAWGFWGVVEWIRLASALREALDAPVGFVVVGAAFDTDLGGRLVSMLSALGMRVSVIIGRPLPVVVEAMKRMKFFFSFPSGLGILAPTVGCPTLMFYPPFLEKMKNAWADPKAIESGSYKGMVFPKPEEAFEWATKGYRRLC